MIKTQSTWKKTGRGNVILEGKGFFISYNSCPCRSISFFRSDTGGSETALVKLSDKSHYRILNGDFRKEYERVFHKGFKGCLRVYNKYKKQNNSSWSS